jgi:hypothetical protein
MRAGYVVTSARIWILNKSDGAWDGAPPYTCSRANPAASRYRFSSGPRSRRCLCGLRLRSWLFGSGCISVSGMNIRTLSSIGFASPTTRRIKSRLIHIKYASQLDSPLFPRHRIGPPSFLYTRRQGRFSSSTPGAGAEPLSGALARQFQRNCNLCVLSLISTKRSDG